MSRYGINFYGPGTYYGEAPLIEFDARPMAAVSRSYGSLTVSWTKPSGNWDLLRLTRDTFGFAPRADMGTILFEAAKATGVPSEWTDPDPDSDVAPLTEGRFYYYTVWVRATADNQWRRAGDVIGLVTKNWGYSGRMYELLPGIYREKDTETAGYRNYERGDLERFLDFPGFEADHIRTELESLKWVNDPSKVSGGLLPLMADQLGFGYEGELGMRLARQQMQNAIYIYKHKGTQLGTEALASVLTGWAPTVTAGKNLVLDQGDSSFEDGTGRWVNVSNATLSRRSTSDASAPGAIAGPVAPPPGASIGDIGSGSWWGMLTAIGAGDMVIQAFANGTALDNRTKSIPVAGTTQYTLSVYSRALDTAATVGIGVEWFDIKGVSLGAVTWNTGTTNATGSNTRHTYTVTSPTTARFLRVSVRVLAAAAGNRHLIDALQVEAGATATAYQSARSIRIAFAADRVNLVKNAGAEVNTSDWPGTTWATVARDNTIYHTGAASFRLTVDAGITGGSNARMVSATGTSGIPVVAGRYYTGSFYVYKAAAPLRQVRFDWFWYTAAGAPLAQFTSTTPSTEVAATWVRVSATALAPPTAAFVTLQPTVITPAANEVHYFDSFLFEDGQVLLDYFDGTTVSNEGEYVWGVSGTPGNTESYYYSRRLIKNYRLNQRLKEFLPAGSTYALLYAGQT